MNMDIETFFNIYNRLLASVISKDTENLIETVALTENVSQDAVREVLDYVHNSRAVSV